MDITMVTTTVIGTGITMVTTIITITVAVLFIQITIITTIITQAITVHTPITELTQPLLLTDTEQEQPLIQITEIIIGLTALLKIVLKILLR